MATEASPELYILSRRQRALHGLFRIVTESILVDRSSKKRVAIASEQL